jgi:aminopeptidase B
MYAQRRITRVVCGAAFTGVETLAGRALLKDMFGGGSQDELLNPLSRLHVPISAGVDPDE